MDIYVLTAAVSEWLGAIAVAWILSISPIFRSIPPVGFLYARRDGIVALSVYILVLAASITYYTFIPPIYRPNFSLAAAPVTDLTQALWLAIIAVVPIVIILVVRRQPARSAGWHEKLIRPAASMGLAMAIIVLFLRNRHMTLLDGVTTPEFFALLTALGIALAEETIFRGYIQLRLVWWLGEWQGLVLTSVLFTLFHLPAWIGHQPVETILPLAGFTFGQGLVLGWVMLKSRHILAPALYRAMSIWVQVLG